MAADGKLSLFTLGQAGVMIDFMPESDSLPDQSLNKAQNAVHEINDEHMGSIRKRPGLKQFNLVNAGAAILGGTPMAVSGYGGAPATGGGGNTGSGTGGGNGTGSAGGSISGTSTSGSDSGTAGVNAAAGTGGSVFGSPTIPAIVVGGANNDGNLARGFYITTPRGAASGTYTTAIKAGGPQSSGFSTGMQSRPFANTADKWMYYMKGDFVESSGGTCAIYRTNGTLNQFVCNIAAYDAVNYKYPVVVTMAFAEETQKLYVAVRDGLYNLTTGPSPSSRVIEIDHRTFVQATVGVFSGYNVWSLRYESTVHKLYIGLAQQYQATVGSAMYLYTWWPGLGYNNTVATGYYMANPFLRCMTSFGDGVLWMGMLKGLTPGIYDCVYSMGFDASKYDGTDGTTNSAVSGGAMTTHYAETLAAYAGIYSMVPFNGSLYMSWYNSGVKAAIVKGVRTTGSKAAIFTDAWTDGGVAGKRVPFELFVFDSVLYAIGSTGVGGFNVALYTLDGVTWTDISTNVFASNPTQGCPLGILWGIDS